MGGCGKLPNLGETWLFFTEMRKNPYSLSHSNKHKFQIYLYTGYFVHVTVKALVNSFCSTIFLLLTIR